MPDAAAAPVPLIGFGQVRHTRLRPAHNAFAYPTYFLLLPMRSLQQPGSAAQSAPLARNRAAALAFHDCDHGDGRGPERGGALAWLDELLLAEGIRDADGEVWLHCYPRVFGFTFKPVSFWYCHRAAEHGGGLRAIVAEVNNTFGERHCYLLDAPQFGVEHVARKVFHVSPFLPVQGRYRFRFLRCARPDGERTVARIDYDDDAGAVLQTSVSGRLEALDAASVRKALWRHPAMTFGVVFHIHLQAWRLWRKRVQFFRKPAPPGQFLSR